MTPQLLNDEGCLRLLAAVVLQWWREAEPSEHGELASFLGMERDEVRSVRPQRIDVWRRKRYVGKREPAEEGDDDVF